MGGIESVYSSSTLGAPLTQSVDGEKPRSLEEVLKQLILASNRLAREDQAIFLAIADFESGLNPAAKNPNSSAHGLFQIIDSTWRGLGMNQSQRNSVQAQVNAGYRLFQENLRYLNRDDLGHTRGADRAIELYRLHHDGPSGIDLGGRALGREHIVPKYKFYLQILDK